MVRTRKETSLYLIGAARSEPLSNLQKLPTVRETLLRFAFLSGERRNVNQALLVTTTELLETWRRSSIPVKDRKNVKKCVQKQVDLWKLLKKHKNKETERKNHFISQLDTLLDISSAKVEEELLILFLNDQRNERRFNLCSINASVLKTKPVEDYAAEDEATGGEEGEVVGGEEAEDAMAVDDVAGSLNYLSLINIIELLIIIIKKKTNYFRVLSRRIKR